MRLSINTILFLGVDREWQKFISVQLTKMSEEY